MQHQEAINELKTLHDIIRWGVTEFNKAELHFGHGTNNAWEEALVLAFHVLHLPPDTNDSVMDSRLTTTEKKAILDLFQQRIEQRIPSAYLTHKAYFAGLEFYVDQNVLIPRSPFAELIENQFQPWIDPNNVHRILDLCTGSACIAIASAYAFPEADIDAIDISSDALNVAKVNVDKHHLEQSVHLIQSDLFEAVGDKQYDVIVSNPPYVSQQEMTELPAEYAHEPSLGLEAGTKGLDLVDTILKQAKNHLTKQGILMVEVGNTQIAVEQAYPDLPFTWLDFERGGEGVFLLTKEQLEQ